MAEPGKDPVVKDTVHAGLCTRALVWHTNPCCCCFLDDRRLLVDNGRVSVSFLFWTTACWVLALSGLVSCSLVSIHPIENVDPILKFGLISYTSSDEQSCLSYLPGEGYLRTVFGVINVLSLSIGGVLTAILCRALVVAYPTTLHQFIGLGYFSCSFGQAFTLITMKKTMCGNNAMLQQAELNDSYDEDCKLGTASILIILASIGWLLSGFGCLWFSYKGGISRHIPEENTDEDEVISVNGSDDEVETTDGNASNVTQDLALYIQSSPDYHVECTERNSEMQLKDDDDGIILTVASKSPQKAKGFGCFPLVCVDEPEPLSLRTPAHRMCASDCLIDSMF
jgi:hypothetical protein